MTADLTVITSADNITAQVTEPQITATTSTGNIIVSTSTKEKELVANTVNLGEENNPDPTIHYRKNEYLSIIDKIRATILKQLGTSENIVTTDLAIKLLNKNIIDLGYINEQLSLNTKKILEDLIDATDDFYGLANIDDDQIASVQKILIDYLIGLSDLSYRTINKSIEIAAITNTLDKKLVEKVLQDNFNIPDIFSRLVNYIRIFTETQNITDQAILASIKILNNTISSQDVKIINFQKVLTDYLTGTTDYTSKNINKILLDQSTNAETINKLLNKIYLDQTLLAQQNTKLVAKVFNDKSNYIIDTNSKIYSKNTLDQTTNSDFNIKLISKTTQDQPITSDILKSASIKIFNNSISSQDINYILTSLQKLDNIQTISTFFTIVNFIKIFSDQVDATDDFYGLANIDDDQIASFQKVIIDQITLLDQFIRQVNFYRSLSDITSGITESSSKDINPNYRDQFNTSELNSKNISKITQDQTANSEQVKFTSTKILNDQLDATDDFYGLANIDDDQIASFQKVLADYLTGTTEYTSKNINKILLDQSTNAEIINKLLNKIYLDQTLLAQQNTKLVEKVFNDKLNSLIDTNSKIYSKNTLDQTTSSDLNIKVVQQNLVDIARSLDNRLVSTSKSIVDQTQLQETINFLRVTTVYYFDQVDATDDFYGLANIDDDQLASVGKVLASSTLGATDFSTRQINPNKVDNVATTELRSAHIQNYFLEEYVEYTQRYVGTTITI